MMKTYRDFYGCHACIRVFKNGSARLTIRTSSGSIFHAKDYKSERDARIAMGRLSDGWTQA